MSEPGRDRTPIADHSSCFLVPNNGAVPHRNHYPPSPAKLEIPDTATISLHSATYTSLRDLLPPSPPPAITSPTDNSGWNVIPMRNHLVKQAAFRLPPARDGAPGYHLIGTPPPPGALSERCGCLCWLRVAILGTLVHALWGATDEAEAEEDNDDKPDSGDWSSSQRV